jgi:hypothetical protein|tara:strand:- start:1163 stop:1966 length:804 start_codon:yes stop_codon:yes gene_type:complete
MQYATGYKLTNLLDVFVHTDGTERRFEKVYERAIKLYKEFDNVFTIVVKNQDQKKQFVNGTECELQISDERGDLVTTIVGEVQDDGSTASTKGHIKFTITESNMLNLESKFYHGALRFTDQDSTVKILYADTRFDAAIQFEVVGGTTPEFIASQVITQFTLIGDEFVSSSVDAKPNQNSNSALHTVVYYLTNFSGSIKIFGTMTDNASYATDSQQSEFFLIDKQTYSEESTNQYVNFTGILKRIAIVVQADDSSTALTGLDKVLYRS